MTYAVYDTKLGQMRVDYEGDIVYSVKKLNEIEKNLGERNELTDEVIKQINEYIEGKRKDFSFNYEMRGTEFQKKVWQALIAIPYGETRTYKDIAKAVGNEKASRAVGLANNKNPMIIVVPCHRVIGASGKLVGYAGGLDMKKFLLEMEHENI